MGGSGGTSKLAHLTVHLAVLQGLTAICSQVSGLSLGRRWTASPCRDGRPSAGILGRFPDPGECAGAGEGKGNGAGEGFQLDRPRQASEQSRLELRAWRRQAGLPPPRLDMHLPHPLLVSGGPCPDPSALRGSMGKGPLTPEEERANQGVHSSALPHWGWPAMSPRSPLPLEALNFIG